MTHPITQKNSQKSAVFQPAQHRHASLNFHLTHRDTHATHRPKLKNRQIYRIPTSIALIYFTHFFSDLFTSSNYDQITVGNLSSYTPVACSLKSDLLISKTATL